MAQILTIIFGIPFITFVPGFCLSYAFFRKNDIAIGTRVLLSFILTILSLPILIYIGSLFGMRLNFLDILIVSLSLIVISTIYVFVRKRL